MSLLLLAVAMPSVTSKAILNTPQKTDKASLTLIVANFSIYCEASYKLLTTVSQKVVLAIPLHAPYDHDLMQLAIKNGHQILLHIDNKLVNWKEVQLFLSKHKEFSGILLGTSADQITDYSDILDFAKKHSLTVIFAYPSLLGSDLYTSVTNHLPKDIVDKKYMEEFFIPRKIKQEEICCVYLSPNLLPQIVTWLRGLLRQPVTLNYLKEIKKPCQAL